MGSCCCGCVKKKSSNVEEGYYEKLEDGEKTKSKENEQAVITFCQLLYLLKPYFWPSAGTDGAILNRIRTTSTWILVGLAKASTLIAPIFLSMATNNLISGDIYRTFLSVLVYCSLRFASSMFKELQSIVFLKVKQQASIQLMEQTFAHLHSLSLNWHLSKRMGNVIRSMDRGTDAANDLVNTLFLYLGPAFLECVAACLIFYQQFKNPMLSVVAFSGVVTYSVVTVTLARWRSKIRNLANSEDNKYHEKATDSMVNFETVKYFTNEAHEVKRFAQSVARYQAFNATTQVSLSVLNMAQQLVYNATIFGSLALAAIAVRDGRMDLGGFVAVNAYIGSMFTPLNFLGSVVSSVVKGLVDVRNLCQLLNESPDIVDSAGAVPLVTSRDRVQKKPSGTSVGDLLRWSSSEEKALSPSRSSSPDRGGLLSGGSNAPADGLSIDFKGVFFCYPSQPAHKGLKNVSFHVAAGTTTAIVGHTGAGKTTISRLLFRFYDPQRGSVEIAGQDVRSCTQRSVRQSIGIVPQDTVLFNDSILYNIQYGRADATFAEVEAAAEAAQIKAFIESLPDKWNTAVGERGLKLSGGEKQRVAIARCLLKNPPIVLLDEATSALDTQTEVSIQEALRVLGRHRTVLVIAHRLSTVREADQIIVMDDGEVAERGSHEELIARRGIYEGLWSLQLRSVPSCAASTAATGGEAPT